MARLMARKWPKFFSGFHQINKDSLLKGVSEPRGSGHFLANGPAKKRPNFNSTFQNSQSKFFENESKLGPHFGYESWPPSWLGGAAWSAVSGQPGKPFWETVWVAFWVAAGGRLDDRSRYVWEGLWTALWKPFNNHWMTTKRRQNHDPRCG